MNRFWLKIGIAFVVFVFVFLNCKSQIKLIGKWDEQRYWTQCNGGSYYNFQFYCDSTYMLVIRNFVDGIDSVCTFPEWFDYSKGRYKMVGDSIFFDGFYYTDSNFSNIKTQGCEPFGVEKPSYKYLYERDTLKLIVLYYLRNRCFPRYNEIDLIQIRRDSCVGDSTVVTEIDSRFRGNDGGLVIYPNPGEGIFNVVFEDDLVEEMRYEVVNLMGQKVAAGRLENNRLDLQKIQDGIYWLKVLFDGKMMGTKIVKN